MVLCTHKVKVTIKLKLDAILLKMELIVFIVKSLDFFSGELYLWPPRNRGVRSNDNNT